MEWWLTLSLFLGGLILVLATGFPVAFSFLLINCIALYALMGTAGLSNVAGSIFSSVCTFTIVPVPLFILMGELMFHSGVADKAIRVIDMWMGRLPGRLSLVTSACGIVFATTSGSTMANTAMLGSIMAPEMHKRGYSVAMSCGPILGVGGLAMLIPPSALMVVMAAIGQLSVAKFLIAGILPGLIMGLIICVYIVLRAIIQPASAPPAETPAEYLAMPMARKIAITVRYFIPIVFIIFMVVGLIILGLATASEAAASGALAAFLVAVIDGRMNLQIIKKVLIGTMHVTVMVFMIIAAAKAFSSILAFTGAANGLFNLVQSLDVHPLVIVILMQVIIIFLGAFMESMSIMMICIPVFLPIVTKLGFDPIWFSMLMLLNIELGQITPPFGMLIFVLKGVLPQEMNVSLHTLFLAAVPYVLITLLVMALVIIFPGLALYLPSLLPGHF